MSNDFKAEFQRAAEVERKHLKTLDYDNDVSILMGGDPVTSRMTLQVFRGQDRVDIDKKRKEFIRYILELSRQQVLDHIRQAQEYILEALNRMDDIINRADDRMMGIQRTLQDMTRRHKELNDTIEARYFEKNADGTYKSKDIADTIAAYEYRTGKKVPEGISPEMLIQILQDQMDFENRVLVPELENELVELQTFRDGVQEQKETFEEENQRIEDALKTIDANASLSDEERRMEKAEILKDASETALDAQMAAHAAEKDYAALVKNIREGKWDSNRTLYDNQFEEDFELDEMILDELQNIKPILPFVP